jgi:hypothetical protein
MLIRVVRPMRRKGSSNTYFVQRIPTDLKGRLGGTTLQVPVGDQLVPVKLTEATAADRVSLGRATRVKPSGGGPLGTGVRPPRSHRGGRARSFAVESSGAEAAISGDPGGT